MKSAAVSRAASTRSAIDTLERATPVASDRPSVGGRVWPGFE